MFGFNVFGDCTTGYNQYRSGAREEGNISQALRVSSVVQEVSVDGYEKIQ